MVFCRPRRPTCTSLFEPPTHVALDKLERIAAVLEPQLRDAPMLAHIKQVVAPTLDGQKLANHDSDLSTNRHIRCEMREGMAIAGL